MLIIAEFPIGKRIDDAGAEVTEFRSINCEVLQIRRYSIDRKGKRFEYEVDIIVPEPIDPDFPLFNYGEKKMAWIPLDRKVNPKWRPPALPFNAIDVLTLDPAYAEWQAREHAKWRERDTAERAHAVVIRRELEPEWDFGEAQPVSPP